MLASNQLSYSDESLYQTTIWTRVSNFMHWRSNQLSYPDELLAQLETQVRFLVQARIFSLKLTLFIIIIIIIIIIVVVVVPKFSFYHYNWNHTYEWYTVS